MAIAAIALIVGLTFLAVRYVPVTAGGRLFLEARADGLKLGRIGKLRIEGLSGDIWHDFAVRRLTIADEQGVWLEADNVAVVWRSGELFQRRFHAEKVTAQAIHILRRPNLTPKTKSGELPIGVAIDSLTARVEMLPAFSVERGLFDLSGAYAAQRGGPTSLRAHAVSLLHAGDHLDAIVRMGGNGPMAINAEAVEAQGGALAGALGLPAKLPFSLKALASGDDKAGSLTLRAFSGTSAPAQADGAWNANGGRISARFTLAASSLTAGYAKWLGPEARIAIGEKPFGDQRAVDVRLFADNLNARVTGALDGKFNPAKSGLRIDAQVLDLSRIAPEPKIGPAHLAGTLTGGWTDGRVAGGLTAERLNLDGYALARASGPAAIAWKKGGGWTADLDLTGAGGAGKGLVAGLLGGAPQAAAKIERLADGRILIRALHLAGAGIKADAEGSRGLLGGLSFKGQATLTNLSALRKGAGGTFAASWSAGQAGKSPWSFTLDGRGDKLATGLTELDRLLGPKPRLVAKATYDHGVFGVGSAKLTGDKGDANGAGTLGPAGVLKFSYDWRAKGPFEIGPIEVSGDAAGKGGLTGTLGAPRVDLAADFDAIDFPRLSVTKAHLDLTFASQPSGGDGRIALIGTSAYGPAHAHGEFRFTEQGVQLSGIDAAAGGLTAAGALTLRGALPSSADLTVALAPGAFIRSGHADARVHIVDAAGGPTGAITATAKDLAFGGGMSLQTLSLKAEGPLNRMPYSLAAEARTPQGPLKLNGSGVAADEAKGWSVTYGGSGRFRRVDFKTITPAIVRFGGPDLSLLASLSGGGGRADIDARQTGDAVAVKARLDGVDLGVVVEDLTGKLTANLEAQGKGAHLTGSLDSRLEGARSRDASKDLALDGTVKAMLSGDRLTLDVNAVNAKGLKSSANLLLPAEASAAPFRIAIDRTKPVSGRFDIDGELRPVWDVFFGGAQTLGGHLVAHGTLAGTLKAPKVTGDADLANGQFEDAATGLKLEKVAISAQLSQEAIAVRQFKAEDGRGGTLGGSGSIGVAPGSFSTFTGALTKFRLIDNDLAEVDASGAFTFTRDAAGKSRLAGGFTIDRAEIAANPPVPTGVVPMDVIEIHRPTSRDEVYTPPKTSIPAVP